MGYWLTRTPDSVPSLNASEYQKISQLAYEHFGLDLRGGKQSLIAARLGKRLRELGLKSFQHYYDYVMADRSGVALANMVDQLTTNHTSFFREPRHFDYLRKTVFPALRTRSRIRLWSAACSSGEEPYSIAMSLLEEAPREASVKVRIKATDISTRMLDKAISGSYPAERLGGIPDKLLQRYLVRGQGKDMDVFQFRKDVRCMIDFHRVNLVDELPGSECFSVIFCRNIMIYFDKPTQQKLVERLSQHLEDGGYLFIGHSESLNSLSHSLQYVCPATYRKPVHSGIGQIGRG